MSAHRDADQWWDSLDAERRTQIWRWIDRPDDKSHELPGQLELLKETPC